MYGAALLYYWFPERKNYIATNISLEWEHEAATVHQVEMLVTDRWGIYPSILRSGIISGKKNSGEMGGKG